MLHILTHCGSQSTKKAHDSEEVLVSTVAVVGESQVILESEAGRYSLQTFQLQQRDSTLARGCELVYSKVQASTQFGALVTPMQYPDNTEYFPAHG